MGDILTYSFDAYLLVTAWNSGLDEEKERRILQVTSLGREAIDSMELFQGLMVFLAERPTAGRIVNLYWISEGCKLHLLEKLTGISYGDYQNWSFLRKMFTRQGRQCMQVIKQIDHIKITAIEYAYMKLKALNYQGTSV